MSRTPNKMPYNATDRPLVTFALFAYNQEAFICEAIEGAFAQTYEPLEIILSDDCSSDRTYEIMQEMAVAYNGPHVVRVRRSDANRGLINHVCDVTEILNGKFVLLAAGDDISKPNRTTRLLTIWGDQYHAIMSKCDLIDERGVVIKTNWLPDGNVNNRLPWLKAVSHPLFVYGASSAYQSDVLRKLPRSDKKIFSEDTPLNLIIQLSTGKANLCDESLVFYRVHNATLSNSLAIEPRPSAIFQHEKRRENQIELQRSLLIYLRDKIIIPMRANKSINEHKLNREIELCDVRLKWYKARLFSRFAMTFTAPKEMQKWFILRVLGLQVYSFIKAAALRVGFQRSLPKG